MYFLFINSVRQQGIGTKTGKAYDFTIAQGLIDTKNGEQMCEVMIDKDVAAGLERGKKYTVEIEFYPDREKRLAMRVVGLRLATPVPAAKAA